MQIVTETSFCALIAFIDGRTVCSLEADSCGQPFASDTVITEIVAMETPTPGGEIWTAKMGTRSRITCRATAEQIAKIDANAQRAGVSRSDFMVQLSETAGRSTRSIDPVRVIALLELIRQLLDEIAVTLGLREGVDAMVLLSALTLVEKRLDEAGAAIAVQRRR